MYLNLLCAYPSQLLDRIWSAWGRALESLARVESSNYTSRPWIIWRNMQNIKFAFSSSSLSEIYAVSL